MREHRRSGGGAHRPAPKVGLVEHFRPGEHARVERVLQSLKALKVESLHTWFSWAEFHTPEGPEWFTWLFERLARQVEVVPCFTCTPPSLGIAPRTSSPPRRPRDFADFLDVMVDRYGRHFEWTELWNEPNNVNDWDWRLDPDWNIFSDMIGAAAHWMKQRGKKTVLAGMCPTDDNWLRLILGRGLVPYIDAVGLHGFPGTWEFDWEDWRDPVGKVRAVLEELGSEGQVWVTEAGYSTWRHDEREQLRAFVRAAAAPVERVYWYAAEDLHPELPTQEGFHVDERHYHMGISQADGTGKLLYRVWAEGGLAEVRKASWMTRRPSRRRGPYSLITGGAGFVGTNLADRLLGSGKSVMVFDNLSRPGVERNVRWLRTKHGSRLQVEIADTRDARAVSKAVAGANEVFHFAAQVAVTTSLTSPINDFEVNARGTLNVLEAARAQRQPPPVLLTSTNKVYGALEDLLLANDGRRWEPSAEAIRVGGIGEDRSLDFHSPYGCSKGAADQYVLDYGRSYGLPTVVFRMSCIYGPHQFGTEDQGWVAHFLIRALEGRPITLYGDGMQVRDVLYVEDLVDAFLAATTNLERTGGRAFNIGGGPERSISLLELLDLIERLHGERPRVAFDDWRVGDQRYYVSNTSKFTDLTGWTPRTSVREGVGRLYQWLLASRLPQEQGAAVVEEAG